MRRAHARRPQPQRHVPVHRHPGRRHDDEPRGHRREGQRRPGLLPDEPRADRERGDEPHRPGLPRGVHQGTPDGVRHRVQSPREDGDGGVARMTAPTGEAAPTETAPAPRPRPVRRALDDLGLVVTAEDIERISAGEPEWLADDRRAAFEAFKSLPSEPNRLYTPYIDLRPAELGEAAVVRDRAAAREGTSSAEADAIAEVTEGRDASFALSDAARAAGITVRLIQDDVDAARDLLTRDGSLPEADRFAQLTRAAWTQGLLIDVPAGVQLEHPIVVR